MLAESKLVGDKILALVIRRRTIVCSQLRGPLSVSEGAESFVRVYVHGGPDYVNLVLHKCEGTALRRLSLGTGSTELNMQVEIAVGLRPSRKNYQRPDTD